MGNKEMTKIIKIDSCDECPNYKETTNYFGVEYLCELSFNCIHDHESIPEWCSLDDDVCSCDIGEEDYVGYPGETY